MKANLHDKSNSISNPNSYLNNNLNLKKQVFQKFNVFIFFIFLISFLFIDSSLVKAQAQTRTPQTIEDEALTEVQDLLKSKEKREKIIKGDKKAQEAGDLVKKMTGGNQQTEQEIYELSSEILENIMKQTKDPKEMMKLLEEAQKDPAAFAAKWSPSQKKKLKDISEKIPAANTKKP